jgi:hypothetical protein
MRIEKYIKSHKITSCTSCQRLRSLDYDDGTDDIYELVNGELVLMSPESFQNQRILAG